MRDPSIDYRRPFSYGVRQLQAEFEAWRPDVIVGTSLGGGIAMALRTGMTPMVLISPMWELARVAVPFARFAEKAGYVPAVIAAAVGAAGAALAPPLASIWTIHVPKRVKPQTIILHAADDDLIPCRHSRLLLARTPRLNAESPMHGVIERLRRAGYRTAGNRANDDPRLVIIGKGHHCKAASDRCPANPGKDPLECLVLAAGALAAMKPGESAARLS